jgi:hypothetical protein
MGDRPKSFSECAQVRIKVCRKEYDWSVSLVYDPRGLSGVSTVRSRMAEMLQYRPSMMLALLDYLSFYRDMTHRLLKLCLYISPQFKKSVFSYKLF